jgi:hypothetical protein
MESSEPRKPRRVRRMVLGVLALGAAFLGWMFRDCGLGLGSGGLGGWGIGPDEQTARELLAPTNATDAGAETPPEARPQTPLDATTSPPIDAPIDAPPGPCQLVLDSAGLTLGGAPATIEDAVRACRATGKARLRATGGARAGTYDDLIRALEQAGIALQLDD